MLWCIFELLEATCEGLSYEEILDGWIGYNKLDRFFKVI